MSIYATLWKVRFPKEGDFHHGCEWIEVTAQGGPPGLPIVRASGDGSVHR